MGDRNNYWVDIEGYEGVYQVSPRGIVRSVAGYIEYKRGTRWKGSRVLKGFNVGGYRALSLYKNKKSKKFYIHRIVAMAFIENKDGKSCVNHKNGIKDDNVVTNLEWVTPKENTVHAMENNLMNNSRDFSKVSKLSSSDVLVINCLYRSRSVSVGVIARIYNVSKVTIFNVCK